MKWKHLRKKESKNFFLKSEDCPQLQVMKPTIQTANQTSQRSNKQKGKLTSRQKMNLSSLGNKDIGKFGNEKWKWTNEWLMWKVKVNTWTIGRESESEHMKNWNEKWKWTHEQLKWKWINWEIDEKYVWERWGFKWRVEIYMWTVKVKTLQIDEVTKLEK